MITYVKWNGQPEKEQGKSNDFNLIRLRFYCLIPKWENEKNKYPYHSDDGCFQKRGITQTFFSWEHIKKTQSENVYSSKPLPKSKIFGVYLKDEKADSQKKTNAYRKEIKLSEMVEADKQEWKKNHWWFEKQDKMLMIANSDKF